MECIQDLGYLQGVAQIKQKSNAEGLNLCQTEEDMLPNSLSKGL
jgi:hypothetical protein